MVRIRQVHSADVVTIRDMPGWNRHDMPPGDAIVTDRHDIAIGIVTADCAPVLLVDSKAGVIGAAHAGWRGAVGGVVEQTVAAMCAIGARRGSIQAAVGPCIAQSSYEVDEEFRKRFGPANAEYFAPGLNGLPAAQESRGRFQFDLPAYVSDCLRMAGIDQVEDLALDTYANAHMFHSYRRATHCGTQTTGRQISVIARP